MALLSLMLLTLAGAVGDEAKQYSSAQVRALVRRLDDREFNTRVKAEEDLIKLGPSIVHLLPEPTERMSAEARQRLATVRQKLKLQEVESLNQPSKVTLTGSLPLSKVWAEIERQTGNRIIDLRPRFGQEAVDKTVALAFHNASFWPAFDQLLDGAELTTYPYAEGQGLAIVNRMAGQAARGKNVFYEGPYRFQGLELRAQRNLRATDANGLSVTIEMGWEPRIRPFAVEQAFSQVFATDERGETVPVKQPEASFEAPISPVATATELVIPLELPSREARKLRSLSGSVEVLLPSRPEAFNFRLGGDQKEEQRQGGVTVSVDRVRKNQSIWEVHMRLTFDAANGVLESHRSWVFQNEAYVISPDKKQIAYEAIEEASRKANEIGLIYAFDLPNGPANHSFVYKTPILISKQQIKYELENLELP